jgi:murein DD-endopeptidase MepM/ murein hydrolase activator NlpD
MACTAAFLALVGLPPSQPHSPPSLASVRPATGSSFLIDRAHAPVDEMATDPPSDPGDYGNEGQGAPMAALVGSDADILEPISLDPIDRRLMSLKNGDTLMQLLLEADVPQEQAHEAVMALKAVYDPRRLKVGMLVEVRFERGDEGQASRFMGFSFQPTVERAVAVHAVADGFAAASDAKQLERRLVSVSEYIGVSLFEAGRRAGVPANVMAALIRVYSYDVDFQRDIQPGDRFELLYERSVTAEGEVASASPDILFAALVLSGKRLPLYRYEDADGSIDYFNARGESVRKALLRTPIDGARLSSSFGMRKHPILGYTRMHKGIDFAAPQGTPIYAAGSGIVDEAGQKNGYGNYIRIRHNQDIQTAYAHMSRFGQGMRKGARVSQGDVIGYVGSTGQSSAPHLHYEIVKNGAQVNPLSVALPSGRNLGGKDMARFRQHVMATDQQFAAAALVGSPGLALVSAGEKAPAAPSRAACSGRRSSC